MDNELINQFFERVNPSSERDCWLWKGSRTTAGYGRIRFNKKHFAAHRLSYMIHKGPIPNEMVICHQCDTPSCVNPHHLWAGTSRQNQQDCTAKRRRAYGLRNGRYTSPHTTRRGSAHGRSTLTEDKVRQIRKLAGTMSQEKIGQLVDTSQANVSWILRGLGWKHVR